MCIISIPNLLGWGVYSSLFGEGFVSGKVQPSSLDGPAPIPRAGPGLVCPTNWPSNAPTLAVPPGLVILGCSKMMKHPTLVGNLLS